MPSVTYRIATLSDLPSLTEVMTRAFDDDARRYLGLDRGGPPGYDNGDFFRRWLFTDAPTEGYVIELDGLVVGGMIVWVLPEREFRLGTLFVDVDVQDRGIGTGAWEFLRDSYPEARRWVLDTPVWSVRNHRFYEKCGFSRTRQEGDGVEFRRDTPVHA